MRKRIQPDITGFMPPRPPAVELVATELTAELAEPIVEVDAQEPLAAPDPENAAPQNKAIALDESAVAEAPPVSTVTVTTPDLGEISVK